MAEIDAEKRTQGIVDPTPEHSEATCKAFLAGITLQKREPGNKWLPDDIFQMTMKLRNPKVENLRGFVCRLIREELDRQTTEELRNALSK